MTHQQSRVSSTIRIARRNERILVVDDSPTIRGFFVALLAEAGYTSIQAAPSAQAALAKLDSEQFELVIADKNLEADGLDGFAVCKAARERAEQAIACMLVTADTSIHGATRAVEEGIDAYLLKPLEKRSVMEKVIAALDRVHLMRQGAEAQAALVEAKAALERRSDQLQKTLERLVEAQRHLAESDKQASLGMLSAGVAHEINNPACFILPNLEYLKRSARKLADGALGAGAETEAVEQELDHHDRMVDRCLQGIERITQVVRTMRLFSRRDDPGEITSVDINELCRSLLDLVTHELDGRAELQLELGEVPAAEGRKQLLAQVVLNLLLNARRSVMSARQDGAHVIRISTAVEGAMVALVVEDSGPLLAADEHALEPFLGGDMTSGPGLHLTLARDILHRFNGKLRLERSDCGPAEQGNRLVALIPSAEQ